MDENNDQQAHSVHSTPSEDESGPATQPSPTPRLPTSSETSGDPATASGQYTSTPTPAQSGDVQTTLEAQNRLASASRFYHDATELARGIEQLARGFDDWVRETKSLGRRMEEWHNKAEEFAAKLNAEMQQAPSREVVELKTLYEAANTIRRVIEGCHDSFLVYASASSSPIEDVGPTEGYTQRDAGGGLASTRDSVGLMRDWIAEWWQGLLVVFLLVLGIIGILYDPHVN